jgi:hypothetical protein
LILSALVPLLIEQRVFDYTLTFAYLLVITIGAIWITVITKWRNLTALSLAIFLLYSLPYLTQIIWRVDKAELLLFAYAFAVLFFITNTVGILRLGEKEIVPDIFTAAGNGILLLAWIMEAAPRHWQSLIITVWMLVFITGAFVIFKMSGKRKPFYVYAGVGIAMLVAATAAELSGAALTIAFSVESALIVIISFLVLRDSRVLSALSFIFIIPVLMSLKSADSYGWISGIFNKDFFVLLVMAISLFVSGMIFWANNSNKESRLSKLSSLYLVAGSIYVYIIIWRSFHAGLQNDDMAVMLSLLIYTIAGLVSYFFGKFNNIRSALYYGGFLLGFVVLRLLIVDIWRMELAGRIITFFVIGALLISTAFIGRKRKVLSGDLPIDQNKN